MKPQARLTAPLSYSSIAFPLALLGPFQGAFLSDSKADIITDSQYKSPAFCRGIGKLMEPTRSFSSFVVAGVFGDLSATTW